LQRNCKEFGARKQRCLTSVPALDRVEEADLQNPPMHGALRKGFFLRTKTQLEARTKPLENGD